LIGSNVPSDVTGTPYPEFRIRFYDQNNQNLTIKVDYEVGEETGTGIGAFVVGSGCNFSVFTQTLSTLGGVTVNGIYVFSGTMKKRGIVDGHISNFMVDDKGDPNNDLIANGQGRVFKDQDKFSPMHGEADAFYSKLPDCPCNWSEVEDGKAEMCGTWDKSAAADQTYHYGATNEARWMPDQSGESGQQCTYDSSGKLITGGLAAGTPDKVSPSVANFLDHNSFDMVPWGEFAYCVTCDESDAVSCSEYLAQWKPNNRKNCTANVINGIDHLSFMIGNMNCKKVTLLFKTIEVSSVASAELKGFMKGQLNYTPLPANLKAALIIVKDFECGAGNTDACNVLTGVINYMP